jgi:hypothetical protein
VHAHTQSQSVTTTVQTRDLNDAASDVHVGDLSSGELDAKTLLVKAGTATDVCGGW